ncbi:hsp70 family protein [Roseimaritima ulvae]|uniref:Chaperone protein DnaK n=1 Tax=Roseimaritima ulvae TaxID=980254 RepID=A0A5B9QLY7_9BACT|nr:hsp70 family protein [Roseimaritima ulvae]QEG38620.1 Chaperone protein DnaK [Roseimaritima ulvae]
MSDVDSEPELPRYVVGIDLGTTNCAMCFVDTAADDWQVETFGVPQWIDVGQWERRDTLPSFHYEWTAEETAGDAQRLPWQTDQPPASCVGVLARDAGARHPGRRAASAKSWLSHDGVDRTADLLPWHGDADVQRLSPVDASAAYLRHLRHAWDHQHPEHPLADQDVIITLPASFDEVARELTVRAAKQAGLPRVFLIEEPQAAFYAWIDRQGSEWQQRVTPGQLILVCDIGGGTTDLTLIRVRAAADGQVQFHRVAVGKHLILGGDNLDLAIAKLAETKWQADHPGESLSPAQWERLVQASRMVKETMLSDPRPPAYTINLPAEGSRLIGGAVQISLSAEDVDAALLDGFFPEVPLDVRPSAGSSGFQEFGLPYAADPAVTRHLAAFLSDHRHSGIGDDADAADRPDLVLFNGGVMAAPAIGRRIVESLSCWFAKPEEADDASGAAWQPEVLVNERLDLAVARGAAYYGMVRRGDGVRIAANLGRSYYMQVGDAPPMGLCLIPGSAEAGQRFSASSHPLELQIGSPVQFPLWVSSTRLADDVGDLVPMQDGEATALPPICTALVRGRQREQATVRVVVESELSEIGTVGLYCVASDTGKRWKLEFDIRSTLETDRDAHLGSGEAAGILDTETMAACEQTVATVFAPDQQPQEQSLKPSRLMKTLQSVIELPKTDWPPSLLRGLWQTLLDVEPGRRQSPQHEARWLNTLGYCLRPGYGVAVDDWRVSQTWRAVHNKLAFPTPASRIESAILWRRIAGGMTHAQQQQLALPLLAGLKGKSGRVEANEAIESWRLLGSLERLDTPTKVELGRLALRQLGQKKHEKLHESLLWAVGRLGSRQPVYGPLNTTVPRDEVAAWVKRLTGLAAGPATLPLALVQLSRRTGDRFRDLPESEREGVAAWLSAAGVGEHYITLVREGGTLRDDEESAVFGESLPLGIRLAR